MLFGYIRHISKSDWFNGPVMVGVVEVKFEPPYYWSQFTAKLSITVKIVVHVHLIILVKMHGHVYICFSAQQIPIGIPIGISIGIIGPNSNWNQLEFQ